jgi:L-ascorbate metabolism protein UlaG (beta-lactamase superfamily)
MTNNSNAFHQDVLMVPIDGHWTLSYGQVASAIARFRPAIVLPMHYDFPEHARLFMQFIREAASVRPVSATVLKFARAILPNTTEVVVLGYPEGHP